MAPGTDVVPQEPNRLVNFIDMQSPIFLHFRETHMYLDAWTTRAGITRPTRAHSRAGGRLTTPILKPARASRDDGLGRTGCLITWRQQANETRTMRGASRPRAYGPRCDRATTNVTR